MLRIKTLDHLVLTVKSISRSCEFYSNILGFQVTQFNPPSDPHNPRIALKFGHMKINLHQQGKEFKPCAYNPIPGSEDLCFIIDESAEIKTIEEVVSFLKRNNISIECGPINRTGANGVINSIYIRDPDHNLIEIAKYVD